MSIEEKIIRRFKNYAKTNSKPSKSFTNKVKNYLKGNLIKMS
jgi:hypothetical protein